MPEIISLLSSPPISPVRNTANSTGRRSALSFLNPDDFESTGDIDFLIEQPAKRRKPSPAPRRTLKKANPVLAALDLSSEPDLLSPRLRDELRPRSSLFHAEIDLSSDHECPASSAPAKVTTTSFTRLVGVADIDEIEFSSSAPIRSKARISKGKQAVYVLSSDPVGPEDDPVAGRKTATRPGVLSNRVMELLDQTSAEMFEANELNSSTLKSADGRRKTMSAVPVAADDILVSSPPQAASRKKGGKQQSASDKAEQRATVKEANDAAKELEKQKKREEKIEKAKEKQKAKDIAEANKSKANKKETTKEMIVQLPESLEGTKIGDQVEAYMQQHEVEFSYSMEEAHLAKGDRNSYPGKIIEWKRRVGATYSEDEGQWVPLTRPRIERSDHIAILLEKEEFAELAIGPGNDALDSMLDLPAMKSNLDKHIVRLRQRYQDRRLIFLISGLHAWVKKNENARNRGYAAAVRAQAAVDGGGQQPTASQTKKRKTAKNAPSPQLAAVTADVVEDLQLYLQINHQPLVIHHTAVEAETASHILSFTQSLSSRPYRIAELDQNLRSASFYMGAGSYKTGEDAGETFCRMLEGQQRVTPSIAQSIVSRWSSPRELVQAFRASDNLMLEDVRKSTNKDGGYSDKRIGPVISKRMYKVFLGRNPEATDGMS
jgi:crossover junction endonuclease EME1